jgi:hypothetical protein
MRIFWTKKAGNDWYATVLLHERAVMTNPTA